MTRSHADLDRLRPGVLLALLVSGAVLGALLGGVTNALSAAVSPEYFRTVLGWENVNNVWRASVAQGVFEGILFGLGCAVVFVVVVGVVSRGCSPYGLAARHLLWILVGALGAWLAGGVVAVLLATLSPEFFRHAFHDVPTTLGAMLRYAWVGGSIWGLELGGLAALVVGCVAFGTHWRRLTRTRPWRPGLETEVHCGQCGYIVKGLYEPRCPECGANLHAVGVRGDSSEGQP
ncbi:MAG: hypothetical protein KA383_03220 [Phycisphaerae bacterium]|nr:hypothetical protein [Phycisphaerae bacterium]